MAPLRCFFSVVFGTASCYTNTSQQYRIDSEAGKLSTISLFNQSAFKVIFSFAHKLTHASDPNVVDWSLQDESNYHGAERCIMSAVIVSHTFILCHPHLREKSSKFHFIIEIAAGDCQPLRHTLPWRVRILCFRNVQWMEQCLIRSPRWISQNHSNCHISHQLPYHFEPFTQFDLHTANVSCCLWPKWNLILSRCICLISEFLPAKNRHMSIKTLWSWENSSAVNLRKFTSVHLHRNQQHWFPLQRRQTVQW